MEIKKKITLPDQLKCLSIGEEVVIKARAYKLGTVRSAVRRLNLTHKYFFSVTEKGMIDSCIVKRVS
jgi:hypothetical protein